TRALELEVVSEDVPAAAAPAAPPSSLGAAADPLLRSGLALTGANVRRGERGDDGILTALEATTLDLTGTKLVVLSACETGLGDVSNGEGVYGLRRALAEAGAETLVMSLWKVDDAATRALMVRYYEKLRAGEGRTEALRHARLSLLAESATRHPFFWSGFVVSGDWRPVDWEAQIVARSEAKAPPLVRGASPSCACQLPGAGAPARGGWLASLLLGLGVGTRRHGNGWKRPRHEKERSG
ncbi:MAG TPA: CHAT domain-containing protein, partial [Polyangiaceae bacterium]|nr:CHAT domain-containing protein [Polyangiaceae bacterium]